jgi:hypothetical protein
MNKLTLDKVQVQYDDLWRTPEEGGITNESIMEFDTFEEFCSICDPLFMSQKGKELVWYNKHSYQENPNIKEYYPKSIHALKDIDPVLMDDFLKNFKGVDQPDNTLTNLTFYFGDSCRGIKAKTETGRLLYMPDPHGEFTQVVLFIPENGTTIGWVINKTTVIFPSYYFKKL